MAGSRAPLLAIASAAAVSSLTFAMPAHAQTVEELQRRLAAQEQINVLLKQRIETLEAQLAGRKIAAPERAGDVRLGVAGDPEEDSALERIFVRRGVAVLPHGTVELTPSLTWSHSGGNSDSPTDDIYGAGLDARIGLTGGWMLGASVPFLHRKLAGAGSAAGVGDISATVWKSILAQNGKRPSFVASVRYGAPTGKNIGSDLVPLGSGFHSVTGRLSSVKTIAPLALYGDISFTNYLGETVKGVKLDRSNTIGFGLGASLTVTPNISLSTGLNFDFEGNLAMNNFKIRGTGTTRGTLELGLGAVLKRNVFLNFVGAFGITDNSPDVTLGISLPVRF